MLESVMIVNGADLTDADFACYMDINFQPTSMTLDYDDVTSVLTLTPAAAVTFNEIRAIYYGIAATDINLCDTNTYQYALSGSTPNLN